MTMFSPKLWRDRQGATAIEYALLASLLSLALFSGLEKYYNALDGTYSLLINAVGSAEHD